MTVIYTMDHPVGGPNGGTVLGYTYGVIAAAGIIFLMWFGVRKRSYSSNNATLKGWLGAHVWIGIALILVVPLHSGFSFGLNVHTLAYALMLLTILSGIWGAIMYLRLPGLMKARRDGVTVKSCLTEINLISTDMAFLGKGKSDAFLKLLNMLDFQFKPSIWKTLTKQRLADVSERGNLGQLLSALPQAEYDEGLKLVSMAHKKTQLCNQLLSETRISMLLKLWLYFHLPISFGCVAAVAIHVISVFYY